jgi:hypothetical protein
MAWRDAADAAQGALGGLAGHLAIAPPPDHHDRDGDPDGGGSPPAGHAARAGDGPAEPEPRLVAAVRYRLRLAVAAAARQADTEQTAALLREAERRGLDGAELFGVAARHWPKPRLRVRAWRAGRRGTTGSLRRFHQLRQAASAVAEREARP